MTPHPDSEGQGVAALIAVLLVIAVAGALILLCSGCATVLTSEALDRSAPVRFEARGDGASAGVDVSRWREIARQWLDHPWRMAGAALDAGLAAVAAKQVEDVAGRANRDHGGGDTYTVEGDLTVHVYEAPEARRGTSGRGGGRD